MFGTREPFDYFECARCGCLQIGCYPKDMQKYYPPHYWDFESQRMPVAPGNTGLRAWIRRRTTQYWLASRPDPVGRMVAAGRPIPRHITWLRRAGVRDLDIRVLDVGCGIGDRLQALWSSGLRRLEGLDPFIETDIHYPSGVSVFKKTVFEHTGEYDLVMLHHSFEHMPNQLSVLRKLNRLVAPSGTLLLRIPVAAQAWREYGADWVQIDAPRHFYLHTLTSMNVLAADAGFRIARIYFDSNSFQFWGSEQYRRDIPLYDPRSLEFGPEKSVFSRKDIDEFTRRSQEWNDASIGDQACFYLRKAAPGALEQTLGTALGND